MELMRDAEQGERGILPTAVWSAMLGLDRQDVLGAGRQIVAPTPAGDVVLEASAADEQGAVAIVIRPRHSLEPPAVPDHWQLTGQQRQIVILVASGMANRQIATALFIGEHTVEWHLRQIFGRLDVGSRTQLVSRYFREAVLGGYHDPDADEIEKA